MKENCPICNKGKLTQKLRDQAYSYRGHGFIIRGVEMMWCNECNEGILNHKMVQKLEAKLKEQHKFIDETIKIGRLI